MCIEFFVVEFLLGTPVLYSRLKQYEMGRDVNGW